MISLIHHPDDEKRLGDLLIENLSDPGWTGFRAAVAFVKVSGVKHIKVALTRFLTRGDAVVSAGIDHAGTSKEGLIELLAALGTRGAGWVFQNSGGRSTFHPKIYLFQNAARAACFLGSGNLTEGGLYTNYEAFVHLQLDRAKPEDGAVLSRLEGILDTWTDAASGMALRLSQELIDTLADRGLLPTEEQIAQASGETHERLRSRASNGRSQESFFVESRPACSKGYRCSTWAWREGRRSARRPQRPERVFHDAAADGCWCRTDHAGDFETVP